MASVKMRDIKQGEAILHNGEVWIVFSRHEQTRGNLRTYWQVKLKHLERGNVYEERFSPDDNVEKVMLTREEWEFLYREGEYLVFMHPESYDQVSVSKELVPEEQRGFLAPNARMNLLRMDEKIVQVELPQQVTLEVTDAPEGARGDTATNVTKLVTVETGAQVRVPGYIKKGEKVRVRTEDGEFLGRAG
jgi:elongation factor P